MRRKPQARRLEIGLGRAEDATIPIEAKVVLLDALSETGLDGAAQLGVEIEHAGRLSHGR